MSARATRHVHARVLVEGLRAIQVVSVRRQCLECGDRPARFQYRGVVKADADHTLCFQCYRAMCERARARRLVTGVWLPALGLPA